MNKIKPFLQALLLVLSILTSRQIYASSEEVLIENFNLTKQSLGQSVGRLGSKFIYKVNTQQYGDELWSFRPNNTPELIKDLSQGKHSTGSGLYTFSGTKFYFQTSRISSNERPQPEIWVSDGTPQGTIELVNAPNADITAMSAFGNDLYLMSHLDHLNDNKIWFSTNLVDFNLIELEGVELDKTVFFATETGVFATGNQSSIGTELFFISKDGSVITFDLSAGSASSQVQDIVISNDDYYAITSLSVYKLDIVTGGFQLIYTEAGQTISEVNLVGESLCFQSKASYTRRMKALNLNSGLVENIGSSYNFYQSSLNSGGELFYQVRDYNGKNELMRTDCTQVGTSKIYSWDDTSWQRIELARLGNFLYFPLEGDAAGNELWRANLTSGTVSRFSDIHNGTQCGEAASSFPSNFISDGERLVFKAFNQAGESFYQVQNHIMTTLLVPNQQDEGSEPVYIGGPNTAIFAVQETRYNIKFVLAETDGSYRVIKDFAYTGQECDGAQGVERAKNLGTVNNLVYVSVSDLNGRDTIWTVNLETLTVELHKVLNGRVTSRLFIQSGGAYYVTEENDGYKLRHTHTDTITEIWGQGVPELFQNTKGRLYFNKFNSDTRKIELWQALNAGVFVKVIDEISTGALVSNLGEYFIEYRQNNNHGGNEFYITNSDSQSTQLLSNLCEADCFSYANGSHVANFEHKMLFEGYSQLENKNVLWQFDTANNSVSRINFDYPDTCWPKFYRQGELNFLHCESLNKFYKLEQSGTILELVVDGATSIYPSRLNYSDYMVQSGDALLITLDVLKQSKFNSGVYALRAESSQLVLVYEFENNRKGFALAVVNGMLYFQTQDPAIGRELWLAPSTELTTDDDNDGLPNTFEIRYGLNPDDPSDAALDFDNDGLTNLEEFLAGTDPTNNDSDGDGILDGQDPNPLEENDMLMMDLDGNYVLDVPFLGSLSNGKQAVLFFDSLTGIQTGVVYLPGWFSGSQVEVISDANSNGINDIVVLGQTIDGKKAWMTFDSQTRKTLNAMVFPGWFQPVQLVVVPDYSGNHKDEILVLGQTSDGKKVWMLHDSGTKVEYSRNIYPNWYSPTQITITADTNGNNKPEILSQGLASDGRSMYMLHDVHTKALLSSQKQANWLTMIEGRNLADISGNSLEDYAWLGRTSNGKSVMRVQDAQSGEVVNTLQYYSWYTPLKLAIQKDIDGSGFAEVVSLGETSDGKKAWLSHDSYHHNQLAARVFPAWYQPSNIRTIPDINNDGVDDILVRGNTSDGKVVLMVQNGLTGLDIKVIVLPNWF